MIAFIFAFLTAFFESFKNLFSKRGLHAFDEYIASFSFKFFPSPFLIPLVLIFRILHLGSNYLIALVTDGLLNVITIILYMRTIKVSEISITAL